MKSEREMLEESHDFWEESAKTDKKQFFASFAIAAGGAAMVGFGISRALDGDIVGASLAIGAGGVAASTGTDLGLREIQDYADSSANKAIWQHQLDQLLE